MNLKKLNLPEEYNYIACFLTLNCNFKCKYCINYFGGKVYDYPMLSGEEWVKGLNRLVLKSDIPITLQGGEPSLYSDFVWIINNIREDVNIDILTNLSFDLDDFMIKVPPERLKRGAPYANIRVSYHPGLMDLSDLIFSVLRMQSKGYSIGVYGVLYPGQEKDILDAQKICKEKGVDFRVKDFLGEFEGRICGVYGYDDAISSKDKKSCLCRSTDLIIAPNGNIYRCHHDLYKNFSAIGNILDKDLEIKYEFRKCYEYGDCNPCDIKIKTNRFQVFGCTAVEIKDLNRL